MMRLKRKLSKLVGKVSLNDEDESILKKVTQKKDIYSNRKNNNNDICVCF